MKFQGKIKPDGSIEFLGAPPPGLLLPAAVKVRFSEITPDYIHPWKARAFRILRALFGDNGRIASWTRRWDCMWVCVILRGPMRGQRSVSRHRHVLIDWEQKIWRNN